MEFLSGKDVYRDETEGGTERDCGNFRECPCPRTGCERHGDCEACRAHHHADSGKPLTRCEKLEKKERKRQEKEERKALKKRRKEGK